MATAFVVLSILSPITYNRAPLTVSIHVANVAYINTLSSPRHTAARRKSRTPLDDGILPFRSFRSSAFFQNAAERTIVVSVRNSFAAGSYVIPDTSSTLGGRLQAQMSPAHRDALSLRFLPFCGACGDDSGRYAPQQAPGSS